MFNKKLLLLGLPIIFTFWWLPNLPIFSSPSGQECNLPLRADMSFSPDRLPPELKIWYDRFLTALYNPEQYLNATMLAKSNNTYYYGRALNTHITSILQVFRITGDPRLLAEVDRLAELMRGRLKDRSILKLGNSTYESDGYLNWLYDYDKEYRGTDVHQMDEMLTHSLIAAVAYTYLMNSNLDRKYAERARFWTDYLVNDFEAKWRERKKIPYGFPFLEKHLTHVYAQWIRYHYYMARLTDCEEYEKEAIRMAKMINRHIKTVPTTRGTAALWDHTMPYKGISPRNPQPFQYARYTVQAAADLSAENFSVFSNPELMKEMAHTLSDFVMNDDSGATFAFFIDGSGKRHETAGRYAISPWTMLGRWASDERILTISERAYFLAEKNPDNPRSIYIPAGMLFSLTRQKKTPWQDLAKEPTHPTNGKIKPL